MALAPVTAVSKLVVLLRLAHLHAVLEELETRPLPRLIDVPLIPDAGVPEVAALVVVETGISQPIKVTAWAAGVRAAAKDIARNRGKFETRKGEGFCFIVAIVAHRAGWSPHENL